MALFGWNKKPARTTDVVEPARKSDTPELDRKGKKEAATPVTVNTVQSARDLSHVLKHPRITEKATMHQGDSVYTFDIAERATKRDIIAAVRAIYKVTPRKVAIVSVPSKARRSMRTGQSGVSKGGKKAYVYLRKGKTITIA